MQSDLAASVRFAVTCIAAWGLWRVLRVARNAVPRAVADIKANPSKYDRYLLRAALISVILYVLSRL